MPDPVIISAAVEGLVDEAVARRLIAHAGAGAGPVYGKNLSTLHLWWAVADGLGQVVHERLFAGRSPVRAPRGCRSGIADAIKQGANALRVNVIRKRR
jgi:hypothetical protein